MSFNKIIVVGNLGVFLLLRYTLEVHATEMQFIGGGRGDEAATTAAATSGGATRSAQADQQTTEPELSDDDIPF